jgi:DNA (cytosine-5)-methyltransferase 1
MKRAVDFFDGCGGMAEGLRLAGYDVVGIENWPIAVASSRVAGHHVIEADIRTLEPRMFAEFDHAHFSPPCTTFSTAGKGAGRAHLDALCEAVKRVMHGEPHGLEDPDETTLLTLEPARFLAEMRPATISFEQVRAVLPVWEAYADALRDLGYSAWVKLISAETLGVPQTRIRAWLGARLDGEARPPVATHSAYYPRSPERLDDGVLPWVSMAEALGWDAGLVAGFPRRADTPSNKATSRVSIDGGDYRSRDLRSCDEPAFVLTEKARSWIALPGGWNPDLPATTVAGDPRITHRGHHDHGSQGRAPVASSDVRDAYEKWAWKRPATTMVGSFRPDIVAAPGYRTTGGPSRQNAEGSMKITIEEALILQGFPADYPLQGTRTAQFKQVGNAVPPPVGRAVMEALVL